MSLDELERAFRETPGPEASADQPSAETLARAAAMVAKNARPPRLHRLVRAGTIRAAPAAAEAPARDDERSDTRIANQSIRVHVDTLEQLMTMVSELVLTRNQLLEIVRRHEESEFKAPLQRLSNVTAELQEGVMKTRMQPIGNAWQKLPRIVRDLSNELGKPIEFEMHGAETELDRQVLDMIKDPLTHMVRNSADHGIESPADRRAAGKPEKGTVRLSAWHEGGHILIEVADDGRGLDVNRIKAVGGEARASARGRGRQDVGRAGLPVHLLARLLDGQHGDASSPAAASASTSCAPTSIRSAAPSTSSRCTAAAPASSSRSR